VELTKGEYNPFDPEDEIKIAILDDTEEPE
jgi:hypothetical protein